MSALKLKTNSVSSTNKSGHSNPLQGLSINYQKILKTIENSAIPITPLEISSFTGIKANTVRKYVIALAERKFVVRVRYGHYVSSKNIFTLGSRMGKSDFPKLHCLKLRLNNFSGSVRSWSKIFGDVKVSYQQHNNGTVTVCVDCTDPYSLDYNAFRLLVELIKNELGLEDWEKVTVSSFEFNNDIEGVRIDGAQAVTMRSLDGSFRRVYQKSFGIRDEVRVVGSVPVENVLTLLKGGVDPYNIAQLIFRLTKEIQTEREGMKFLSGLLIDGMSSLRRYWEAITARTTIETTTVKTNMQTQTKTTKVIHHE